MKVLLRQAKLNKVMVELMFALLEQGFFSHIAQQKQGQSNRIEQEVVPTKLKTSRKLPEIWKFIGSVFIIISLNFT